MSAASRISSHVSCTTEFHRFFILHTQVWTIKSPGGAPGAQRDTCTVTLERIAASRPCVPTYPPPAAGQVRACMETVLTEMYYSGNQRLMSSLTLFPPGRAGEVRRPAGGEVFWISGGLLSIRRELSSLSLPSSTSPPPMSPPG